MSSPLLLLRNTPENHSCSPHVATSRTYQATITKQVGASVLGTALGLVEACCETKCPSLKFHSGGTKKGALETE